MAQKLSNLFDNNRKWSEELHRRQPDFFEKLSKVQHPEYLWVGCSDSRVPANQIVGLLPGELFVHRNVANVVVHADLNCLSVMQFAVDVLKVMNIIVCGHYGCGGVLAALRNTKLGLVDNWLRHVQDVHGKHRTVVDSAGDERERHARLCELNVVEQAINVAQTTVVQDAWGRGQDLTVHGWIYSLRDGLLREVAPCMSAQADIAVFSETALRSRPF